MERIHVVFAIAKEGGGFGISTDRWTAPHESVPEGVAPIVADQRVHHAKKKLPTTKNVQIFLLLWAFFPENGRFLHFSPL